MHRRTLYAILTLLRVTVLPIFIFFVLPVKNPIVTTMGFSFLFGFILNFWYSGVLGASLKAKIFASIFSDIGIFFLLGYNRTLIKGSELIKSTFSSYKNNFSRFLPFLSIIFLSQIISFVLPLLFLSLNTNLLFLLSVVSTIFVYLLMTVLTVAIIRIAAEVPNTESFKNNIRYSLRLFFPALIANICMNVVVILGFLLFIIPGILFSVWFIFTLYGVAIDNKKPIEALRWSRQLIRGRWWATLWRLLVPTLFYGIIFSILFLLLSTTTSALQTWNPTLGQIIFDVLSAILISLYVPFGILSFSILYTHLKQQS